MRSSTARLLLIGSLSLLAVGRAAEDDHDHDDHDHDHDHDHEEDPCFHGANTLTLESGASKPLSEIKVGDRVLVADASGRTTISDVVFLPHDQNTKEATFFEMNLVSGKHVSATPNHLMKACDGTLMFAKSVGAGSCLLTVNGDEKVESVIKTRKQGVYTAVTREEFIVVNGVIASPYAHSHALVHAYYNIHRVLHGVLPSLLHTPAVKYVNLLVGSVAFKTLAAAAALSATVDPLQKHY
mmetsp:Transcript_10135/g.24332  ORF Transcript_10135/g.24332 Transcript_10135/m.24332 type:complete len:240 (-) Transcript_10135:123-842(-)